MTLLEHIQALNLKTKREENRGIRGGNFVHFYVSEDIEYWNRSGVFTPDDFERYELANEYFEIHREIYGFKPHWGELFAKSAEQIQALITDITK